ncbi:hypothetical protein R3O67_28800 [Bacillus cereus]|uniref:hypothetical protein n=1 Tax=Bacillus cereus TaxID=1396 RepID=UPI003078ABB5
MGLDKVNLENFKIENIDLNELKDITAKVQENKRAEEQRKIREEMFQKQMELEKKKNGALAIIQTIPYVVKQAAIEGKSGVNIMELKYEDFTRSSFYDKREKHERLDIKAKMVWDYLVENRLNPKIYTAHDGVGIQSWDYIQANW